MTEQIQLIHVEEIIISGKYLFRSGNERVIVEISSVHGSEKKYLNIIHKGNKVFTDRVSKTKLIIADNVSIRSDGLKMVFNHAQNERNVDILKTVYNQIGSNIEYADGYNNGSNMIKPTFPSTSSKPNMRRSSEPLPRKLPLNQSMNPTPEQHHNQLVLQPKSAVQSRPPIQPKSEDRFPKSNGKPSDLRDFSMVYKPESASVKKADLESKRGIEYGDFSDEVMAKPAKTHSLVDPEPIKSLPGLHSDSKVISRKYSPLNFTTSSNFFPKTSYAASSKAFSRNSVTAISHLPATPPHNISDMDDEDIFQSDINADNAQIRQKRVQYFDLPQQPKKQKAPLNQTVARDLSQFFEKTSSSLGIGTTTSKATPLKSDGGIVNLGNTCYMAAVMQALLGLPRFVDDMLSPYWEKLTLLTSPISEEEIQPAKPMSCLKQVIDIMKQVNSPNGVITLANLKAAMDSHFSRFIGNEQHDAHEFFLDLLSSIHEDLLAIISKNLKQRYPKLIPSSSNKDSAASPGEQNLNQSNNSILSENNTTSETIEDDKEFSSLLEKQLNMIPTQRSFYSEISNTLICMHCGYSREPIIESYTNYGLDLVDVDEDSNQEYDNLNMADYSITDQPFSSPFTLKKSSKAVLLQDLLGDFFKDDVRELRCESCRASEGMVKVKKTIQSMPNVLVVHLKRFKYDLITSHTVKVHTSVSFPKLLNLDEFAAPDLSIINLPSLDEVSDDNIGSGLAGYQNRQEKEISPIDPVDIIEDDHGWLCPRCHESNVKSNAMCSHCLFQRTYVRPQNRRSFSDISPITSAGSRADDEVMSYYNTPAIFDFPTNTYKLVAVIRHRGTSSTFGHYITDKLTTPKASAIDKTPDMKSPMKRSQWQRCDDALVTNISEDAVFDDQSTPYMLFYARQ